MKQILDTGQTTSDEYIAAGSSVWASVGISVHTGGTWKLQMQFPDGVWVDTAISFTAVGIESGLVFIRGRKYRLTGGTVGAKGWIAEFS